MKKIFLSSLLLTTIFIGCSKDISDKQEISVSEKKNVSFDRENLVLSFNSVETLKNYMELYEQKENEIEKFYEEGLVPYRPIETLNEQNILELTQKKQAILEKEKSLLFSSNESILRKNVEADDDYDEEDDDFITNDKFASLLNAKGEIIVGDTIHRYTPKGRFSSHISKKEILDDYISKLTLDYEISEGTVFVTKDIQRFIPLRDEFKKYQIVDSEITENENKYVNDKSNSKEINLTSRKLPTSTEHYNSCHNTRSHWIDRIFGVSYTCEYKFTKKRKLRTTFAVENYGFHIEVYAQAKFKQKTWFGWFSSRDAEKVYLRVNHAALTFEQKEVTLKKKDVENAINYGKQVVKWFKGSNETPVVNSISTPDGGIREYVSDENDFNSAESSWSWFRQAVNLPKILIQNANPKISVDFGGVFDAKKQNIVVLSIFNKKHNITNRDIMKFAFNQLKSMGATLQDKPTGIFLVEHDTHTGKIVSRSYTLFDQVHEATGLAIVRNNFKIPKKATLEGVMFGYTYGTGKNHTTAEANISYPVVQNIDLNIETGAFYDGRWAGSKLTVIYNR